MTENGVGDPCVWLDEEHAYAVVIDDGAIRRPQRSGLSHAHAMILAEELRGAGQVAVVVHVIGNKSYEVDRYPAR